MGVLTSDYHLHIEDDEEAEDDNTESAIYSVQGADPFSIESRGSNDHSNRKYDAHEAEHEDEGVEGGGKVVLGLHGEDRQSKDDGAGDTHSSSHDGWGVCRRHKGDHDGSKEGEEPKEDVVVREPSADVREAGHGASSDAVECDDSV